MSEFWLGGSTTYIEAANAIGVKIKHSDYDLALIGGTATYHLVLKTLKSNNFKILKNRPYFLKFNKAFQIVAEKDKFILDIAIVRDICYLGHFNWESIFWHYPSGEIRDPYNAIQSFKEKKLKHIIPADGENPFIFASRLINLCSRFQINIFDDEGLRDFSYDLSKNIASWRATDVFNDIYAKEHAYFNILKAVAISEDKLFFIESLKKVRLLGAIFPELEDFDLIKRKNDIEKISSLRELVLLFKEEVSTNKSKTESFNKKLKLISGRLKDYERLK